MSLTLVHSCSRCEYLVTIGQDRACNALSNIPGGIFEENDCVHWEEKDSQAQQQRDEATAQQVIPTIDLTNDIRRYREQNLTYHPHYIPIHVREESQERQNSLNKVYEIIRKIEIQREYIISRFNVYPTQVLLDRNILHCLIQHNEIGYSANNEYGRDNKRYYRDLEIISCHRKDDNPTIEVLFLNHLM